MPGPRIFLVPIAAALLLGASTGTPPPKQPHYLFYLHGRIVEDQGPAGVSPKFGRYDYPGILAAFRARGLRVVSEVRPSGTDPSAYADKIAGQVRALLARGIPASHVTIVGASKGAVIASLVSTRLREPRLRYV